MNFDWKCELKKPSYDSSFCHPLKDFWTTKCTRCPDALDQLEEMAQDKRFSNVQFSSIVLDECDGARNIIEEPDEKPRWENIDHYHMDIDYKETAKQILGFNQVPFYVVLNEDGMIVQKGSKKQINFDSVPGVIQKLQMEEKKMELQSLNEERVFCMDDDF